jgi:hypothetical protein
MKMTNQRLVVVSSSDVGLKMTFVEILTKIVTKDENSMSSYKTPMSVYRAREIRKWKRENMPIYTPH